MDSSVMPLVATQPAVPIVWRYVARAGLYAAALLMTLAALGLLLRRLSAELTPLSPATLIVSGVVLASVWFGWRSRARRALASFRSSS